MLTTSTLWNYDFFFIFLFQDIEVGKAVRPQLAMRVSDAHAAWKKVSSSIFFLKFLDYMNAFAMYTSFFL
jgi:hypothetical protein